MLVPGLAEIQPRKHHTTFRAFVSGRLDANARRIKQGHLSVASFAHAIYRCDNEPELPALVRGDAEPAIVMRGVDLENPMASGISEAEADLRRYAESHAGRAINIQALPFTENRTQLFEDLQSSSICLMPSWHEGFGLAAWEAIAAGVPLIVSQKSGVHRLITEIECGLYTQWTQSIDVLGQVDEPYFRPEDKTRLAAIILSTARDYESWKDRALRLREAMLRAYSWRSCGESFIEATACCYLERERVYIEEREASTPPGIGEAPSKPPTINLPDNWEIWLETYQSRWQKDAGLSPSQLLRAEEALVPFAVEATPFLLTQIQWALKAPTTFAVRLLTAPGGSGKTRLALELCCIVRREGWIAGLLRSDCTAAQLDAFATQLINVSAPALVVIDYAETRTDIVLTLLTSLQARCKTQSTRVLLLARDSGDWWEQLPSRDARCEALLDGSATTGPYALPAAYANQDSRASAFQQALTLVSKRLELPCPNLEPDLSAEHFAHPLYLQLAALTAALGDRAESAEALPRALLNHERRYWLRAASACVAAPTEADVVRLMVLATLHGTIPIPKAIDHEWLTAGGSKGVLPALFRALVPLYPGHQGLQGLRPDLLGEVLVAQGALAEYGAALLDAVLGSTVPHTRRSALTVLARACKHRIDLIQPFEDALGRQFHICAVELVQVCIETPGELPLLARRAYVALAPNRASQVAGILHPLLRHEVLPLTGLEVDVRKIACATAQRRAERRGATCEDFALFAKRLGSLGEALRRDGQSREAFSCVENAKNILERLSQTKPGAFDPDWANALNNYAVHLRDEGRIEDALAVCMRAMEVRERLKQRNPVLFSPAWAASLNNCANLLLEAGRENEALQLAKRALDIRQGLSNGQPDADFATSLGSYAIILRALGRIEEALSASMRSLEVRRKLALSKPERFEADLATALTNYANLLDDADRTREALDAAREALTIRERLALAKPERFNGAWAASLTSCGVFLSALGRIDEGLELAKQSLDIVTTLAESKPERFTSTLGNALSNYAAHLAEVGNSREACDVARRALDIRRRLAESNPERFEPEWALSLSNYASHLVETGSLEDGLKASKLALNIRAKLAQNRPERFESEWATSATNYSSHLVASGCVEQGLDVGLSALKTLNRLASAAPNRFKPERLRALANCSMILADLGNFDEALSLGRQAVALASDLAARNFGGFIKDEKLGEAWVRLLEWIKDPTTTASNLYVPNSGTGRRDMKSIAFGLAVLNAALATDIDLTVQELRSAFAYWEEMHDEQRFAQLSLGVLACKLAAASQSKLELNDTIKYVTMFENMRSGRMPAWMLTVLGRFK